MSTLAKELFNKPIEIKHSVWPTQSPPVCTSKWTQHNWDTFELAFKPDDYRGGHYDEVAFSIYSINKDSELINRLIDRIKNLTPKLQVI